MSKRSNLKLKKHTFFIVVFLSFNFFAQSSFRFDSPKKYKETVKFELINNLIVLPLEINGKKLSFILDSGVNKTILFNLSQNDSLALLNTSKVTLQGLGDGKPVSAIISKKNRFDIKGVYSESETIFVILKDYFDLSSKMGKTIHGIIGYNLLKNFVVKINYNTKKLTFYNPKKFKYKKCRKCETIPFQFYRRKPFIDSQILIDSNNNKLLDVKLLVDSGGSDAIWLFEKSKKEIVTPKKHFYDVLGEGLSGLIHGNRSRIKKFKLGRFEIENPTASFLDSVSTHNARNFKKRNGSVGGGILKRFIVWFDYPNRQITLKKNGSFKTGFNYNMSGIDVVFNGKQLVKEKNISSFSTNQNVNTNSISFVTSYSFKFKPSYKIKNIVKNSPADKAGLQKNDIIISMNNKPAHQLSIREINGKFQLRDGLKINMVIKRKGKKMKFQFRLKKSV